MLPTLGHAQRESLIGLDKEDVKASVRKNHRGFALDQSIIKQQFNYLKFVNGSQTITWILYFSDSDKCTSTKMVCDYSEYDFVLEELDEECERVGAKEWQFQTQFGTYRITMEELDWYFTLREKVMPSENE